ncbi:hypothetical protein PhCBS80983_g04983 [Powellomyces hirtus]|uniref:F-box domain-containing protein n=1 Tax=Powellomyces hirtus TaxID=109895 RepID=A0A507DVT0_9FUNG|nr:hypothetical protein PhCBS80983_g04983 [Powellomyces hirtus]
MSLFFNKLFRRSSDAPKPQISTADENGPCTASSQGTSWDDEEDTSKISKRISATDSAFGVDDFKRVDFLLELPFELAVQIAAHVKHLATIQTMAAVSKRWQRVARENEVWRSLYLFEWLALSSSPNGSAERTSQARRAQLQQHRLRLLSTSGDENNKRHWQNIYRQGVALDTNWRRGNVSVKYLSGHEDAVYCIQFDKRFLLSGSRDRTLRFWDLKEHQCVRTLEGHRGSVLCLQYDDKYIVTGSSDQTIVIWDHQTRKLLHTLRGHTAAVLDVCFNDWMIVSCSKDCTIKLWSLPGGQLLRTLEGHHAAVNAIHLHGDYIASASGDCTVKLWDVRTGRCTRDFAGHTRGLACVQFDGDYLVSGSNDHTIKVWDAATGLCLRTLVGHEDLVRTLCFNRKRIVSGSYDQTIKVWDYETGDLQLNLKGAHSSWIFHVQMDATKIISSSQDKKIVVWDFSGDIENASDFI